MKVKLSIVSCLIIFASFDTLVAEDSNLSVEETKTSPNLSEQPIKVIGSYYKVQLILSSKAQFEKYKNDSAFRGIVETIEAQIVYVSVEQFERLGNEGLNMTLIQPPLESSPSDSIQSLWEKGGRAGASDSEGGEANSYVDGRDYGYCSGSCNTSSPYYAGGVDLDCGSILGTYAWWRHYLPYTCTQSYSFMYVGFHGSGTGFPDNGADVIVYNWLTESYDLVASNVGTDQKWYMYQVSSTIGKYISATYHNVIVELYASGIDCSRVNETRVRYYFNDKPAICYVSPTNLPFPDTDRYGSSTKTFIIRNDGCGTLNGSVGESSQHFSVFPLSYSLGPGSQKTFTVTFSPQSCGYHSATISTGTGCDNVSVSGNSNGPTDCYVSRTNISFPDTDRYGSNTQNFIIRNDGCGTLSGSVSESSSHFSVSPSSYNLSPGNQQSFTVTFSPQSCGFKSTTINTGSECSNISVSGDCNGPTQCSVSPQSFTIPDTDVGQSRNGQFVISNTGCGTISGSISESCPDFSVSPSSISLGAGQSTTVTVTFSPVSCGSKNCTINTPCGGVTVSANSPCYGTVSGQVVGTDGSTPVSGVTVCVVGSGFNSCDETDGSGVYEITGIPYDQCYQVTPQLSNHIFEPASSQCCINSSTPNCTKTFTDITTFVVSGNVATSICDIPVENVDIYLNNIWKVKTDASGNYGFSAEPGSHTLDARLIDHTFADNPRTINLQSDILEDFVDNTVFSISGYCNTGCADPITGVTVTATRQGQLCTVISDPTTSNGFYSISVPEGSYTLTAEHVTLIFEPSELVAVGPDQVYDFTPRTYLRLVTSTEDPECNAVAKGESHIYSFTVLDGNDCPVTDATITVTDDVGNESDSSPTPEDIFLDGQSSFEFVVTGGRPGIDKQLSITISKSGYDNSTNINFATQITVTGRIYKGTTFTTKLADQTPFMILYDPPGDMSYSYLESTEKFFSSFGMFVRQQNTIDYEVGVGVDLPFLQAGLQAGGSLAVSGGVGKKLYYEISNTSRYETEHSSPDGEPILKGPGHGTMFLTAGLNLIYGVATEISVDPVTCLVTEEDVFGLDIAEDQNGITSYYSSSAQIERDVLTDPVLPDEEKLLWQRLLDLDLTLDNQITSDEYSRVVMNNTLPQKDCITWSGGGGTGSSTTETVSGSMTFESEIEIEEHIAVQFGFSYGGVGANGKVKVSTKIAVGTETIVGHELSNTIGYWLEDGESVDYFSTCKYWDAATGIPLFISESGTRTSCPWEPFTDANEGIDIINTTGVWDTTVCYNTTAVFELELNFIGLLSGGSTFLVDAPAADNPCGAQVLFNGNPGPIVVEVPDNTNSNVSVSILPLCDCNGGVNVLNIRARSACDGQIVTYEEFTVRCEPCGGLEIVTPIANARITGDVVASCISPSADIDGVRFYTKRTDGTFSLLCYDQVADPPDLYDFYKYACVWPTGDYEDGSYELIAVPVKNGLEEPGESDTIAVTLDNTCPQVIGTEPIAHDPYVNVIKIELSELMNSESIDCNSFRIVDVYDGSQLQCDVIAHTERVYEFVPLQAPNPDHEYEGICEVSATDLAGNTLCSEFRWRFNTPDTPCPFEIFAVTNLPAAFIAQILVEGVPADVNDCVGAFDSDGTCCGVGTPIINNGNTYINLVLYGDDPTTPNTDEGMNEGECFTLKLFDVSENQVMQFSSQFCCWTNMNGAPLPGECGGDPLLVIDFESTSCTNILLCEGWNLISFATVPDDRTIDSVFKDCIADLLYVTSFDNGSVYYDPNGPDFLNTLTEITPELGYWVKVSAACTLFTCGTITPDNHPVDFDAGWNLVAYWPNICLSPQAAFQTLIDSENLNYVTGFSCDEGSKYYDPNGPIFLNTLTELCRPYGYWLKISDPVTGFMYPTQGVVVVKSDNRTNLPSATLSTVAASGFTLYPWEFSTTNLSGAFISKVSIKNSMAEVGDVIAAFDPLGNCAGAATVIMNSGESFANLQIYGDDPLTSIDEGMNAGEKFTLRLYDQSTKTIYSCLDTFSCWTNTNGAPLSGECNNFDTTYDFSQSIKDVWAFTPTSSSGTLLGQLRIMGNNADSIDIVAAFGEDGACVGYSHIVLNNDISYINLPIYGDDPTTPNIDEGINQGESFYLRAYDALRDSVYGNWNEFFYCWSNTNGAPLDPPCNDYNLVYDLLTDAPDNDDEALPITFHLSANYPNPFNLMTTIEYSLPRRSHVTITIYNILGKHVRTLVNEEKSAGAYTITWDGKSAAGRIVATGIYLYRIEAGEFVKTKKMILLK